MKNKYSHFNENGERIPSYRGMCSSLSLASVFDDPSLIELHRGLFGTRGLSETEEYILIYSYKRTVELTMCLKDITFEGDHPTGLEYLKMLKVVQGIKPVGDFRYLAFAFTIYNRDYKLQHRCYWVTQDSETGYLLDSATLNVEKVDVYNLLIDRTILSLSVLQSKETDLPLELEEKDLWFVEETETDVLANHFPSCDHFRTKG